MAPTGCGQDGEHSRGKRSVRRGRKNQLPDEEPWGSRKRYGSDLTKTIRARGRQGLHREAGHTTVPDPHAALRSKSYLSTRGASTYVRPVGARPETTDDAITTRNSRLLAADSPPNVRWHKPCREPAALQDPLTQNPLTEGARHV